MARPLNILLVAGESAGVRALRAIHDSGHRLVAVLAVRRAGLGLTTSVADAADQLGYPVWPARRVRQPAFARAVRRERVDLLVSVRSLRLVHPSVLAAPAIGAYNLHTGPLPRYAGRNAVSWAICRGETAHGVTLHRMTADLDAGPIAYQATFPIGDTDTAARVTAQCVRHGIPFIARLLADAARGPAHVPAMDQDLSQREVFGPEVPHGGRLVWSWPARRVVDFIRACDFHPFPSPWGTPRATLAGRAIGIARAHRTRQPTDAAPGTVGEAAGPAVAVACGDEWILVDIVVADGERLDAASALQRGGQLTDGW